MSGSKIIFICTVLVTVLSSFKTQNTTISKDFVLGKFNYKVHPDFIKVHSIHSAKTLYLQTRVYDSFIKMYNAALENGIDLKILSGTRNFNEQKAIWERKWKSNSNLKPLDNAKTILRYSSMPSSSRHHWGTDIDLIRLNNSYFETNRGKKEFDWLTKHANSFGFYHVYTPKTDGRQGYNLEKWHWSFLPLASKYLNFYNKTINYNDFKEFDGAYLAKELQIIEHYVNGISEQTLHYN